jgi:hypothetical protein
MMMICKKKLLLAQVVKLIKKEKGMDMGMQVKKEESEEMVINKIVTFPTWGRCQPRSSLPSIAGHSVLQY